MIALYMILMFIAGGVVGWSIYDIAVTDAEREQEEYNRGEK